MSVTDEIKARLDIVSYIGQYVQLKKAGRSYKACCPFHAEKTPSFNVDPDRQMWRCFGACAEGGDIFSFAQKMHGWDFKEALHALGQQAGVEVRKQTPEERQQAERLDQLRGLMKTAAETYHTHLLTSESDAARSALAYAQQKRGFTRETIERFQIGYAPAGWQNLLDELTHLGYDEEVIITVGLAIRNDKGRIYDRFRNRLMIPIRDERGRVIAFGARALDPEDNPKYLNSPQTPLFDKSAVLFGLDTGKRSIREQETAVIVEGYMDSIQAQQAGFHNVVAQMGTAMTERQLALIAPRYAKKVVLALDSDAAGQKATRRSLETARQALEADYAGRMSVDMRVLQIPDAKDPDDLIREGPEEWEALVDAALPVADFVINMETANLTSDSSFQEREAIARNVLPILTASENNLYTQDNIQKLAMRLRIAENDLLAWATEQKSQRKTQPTRTSQPPAHKAPSKPVSDPGHQPNFDLSEPPPGYDDDDYENGFVPDIAPPEMAPLDDLQPVRIQPTVNTQSGTSGDLTEGYCLRVLFQHPDVFYQINRQLREMAEHKPQLLDGPLCDFGVGDFTQSTHRTLMQMFLFAVRQHEHDLLDFLMSELDPAMRQELEQLMQDDDVTIQQQVNGRFDADRDHLFKQHMRRKQASLKPGVELQLKALEMRRLRLKRELDEYRFTQMDLQQKDPEAAMELGSKVMLTRRALQLIDEALQQQRRQLV